MKNKLSSNLKNKNKGNEKIEKKKKIVGKENEEVPVIRRSKRIKKTTHLEDDYFIYLVENDPKNFKEAMRSTNAIFWKEAILETCRVS